MRSLVDAVRPVGVLLERDYRILRSYRLAVGLDVVFGLIDLLVYYFVSKTFGNRAVADLHGAPTYFAFVAVGIVLTLVVTATSTELTFRLRDEQLTGTMEIVCAEPISSPQLAFGFAVFPFAFAAARGALYLFIASFLPGVDFPHASWFGCGILIVASALALVGIGIGLASLVIVVKRGAGVVGLVGLGLGLAGGAFFPLQVLPAWLRWIGDVVPTRYAFDGMRAALFVGSGWAHDALILVLCSAVTLPLGLALFARALAVSRNRGTLAQY